MQTAEGRKQTEGRGFSFWLSLRSEVNAGIGHLDIPYTCTGALFMILLLIDAAF